MTEPAAPTRRDYREAMHTVIRAAVEVMTLQEVADVFGVTRERIRQIAPVGHRRRSGIGRTPAWELPDPRDRRRIRELMALGMSAREAVEVVGYLPTPLRTPSGMASRCGSFKEDQTWRGWKTRVWREVQKLIAADALREGAFVREAAEVSGLSQGSVAAWCSTGVLPRSRHPRGGSYRRKRRPGPRTVEVARLWNSGLSAPEVAARLGVQPQTVYAALTRARAAGMRVEQRRHGNYPISKPISKHYRPEPTEELS